MALCQNPEFREDLRTEITYDYGGKDWPWRKEVGHLSSFFPPYELVSLFKAYILTS